MSKQRDDLIRGIAQESEQEQDDFKEETTKASKDDGKERRFSISKVRDHRVQIMVTKREFEALENKLGRRQSLSDYCWKRMRENGFFDPPTPEPESPK